MITLTTLDQVQRHLGLTDSQHIDRLGLLIAEASEAIEAHCGRELMSAERTEYHDGGSSSVVLRARPVSSVESVHDDPDRDFLGDSRLSPSDFSLDELSGILERKHVRFLRGTLSVRVTYTAGYETIPDDIARACTLLVAHWFNSGQTPRGYRTGLWPRVVRGLLWPYTETRL